MTATDLEYELGITAPAADQLKSLERLVNEAYDRNRQIEEYGEALKALKEEQRELLEKTLPDAMASAGMESFKTNKGLGVKVSDFVSGSLKASTDRVAALDWIVEVGAQDLIKNRLLVEFGRKEHNWAEEVKGQLTAAGVSFLEHEDIHPQTLAAFARERMRNGEAVDLALLGLYAGRVAKIEVKGK